MVQCEKCGEQFPLTEHRIGCHYIVYDRPIKAMGRDAGNFARTETVTMLATERNGLICLIRSSVLHGKANKIQTALVPMNSNFYANNTLCPIQAQKKFNVKD
jgi:hypothetical protein